MSEFISLYSGSSGNSSVVRCGQRYLIVDMGKGVRTTSAALKALGLAVSDCDGILVTHEHSDHVKGLSTFLKKHPLPVYGAAAGQILTTTLVDSVETVAQNDFRATFTAKRLSFWQDSTEVAYVSDNRLYIRDITVLDSVTLGGWKLASENGLAFQWIGG